jgi:hypothetical protein
MEEATAEPQLLPGGMPWKWWDSHIVSALESARFWTVMGLAFCGIVKGIQKLKSVLNRTDNGAEYR